jgi:predicted ATP-grasp superfamily ATP-dependent carboligase
LKKIFFKIDPSKKIPFLLGSGFAENHKISEIFNNRKNYGNDFEVNNLIKSRDFFKKLQENQILYPKIFTKAPSKKTLIKSFKSFGSQKIKILKNKDYNLKKNEYFQEYIDGKNTTVQFICCKKKFRLISICKQVLKKDTFFIDYLITKKITSDQQKKILNLVKKVVKIFNLKGINNIDIISNKGKIYLIEINSRPGLSSNIIYKLNGGPFINEKKSCKGFQATKIIYSKKEIVINKKIIKFFKENCNSNNFSELPNERDIIKVNKPICLLHLMANTEKLLEQKLNTKAKNFLNKLENNL